MPSKVLIVASVISFIEWFNKENIDFLQKKMNCEVHIACNLDYVEDTDEERTKAYIERIKREGVILHNIQFCRSPFRMGNVKAFRSLRQIIRSESFDCIHCHTPTASILTRLAAISARKKGTVVMYTSHGFHFHNAAPKMNWLLYYPVERIMSHWCDYIVTINREDFRRASKFACKNVRYIPGVGVDIRKIRGMNVDVQSKRQEMDVPADKVLIISAGELIDRKNHAVIIRALARVKNPDVYYVIAGKGPLKDDLMKLAAELEVADRVRFLGFRTDVCELYHAAEISAFPSRIEGLGLAGIEAMAAGVPLVSSNVHGILDYVIDGKTGFAISPDDVDGFAAAIEMLAGDPDLRRSMRENCYAAVEPFEISNALETMWGIYREILLS